MELLVKLAYVILIGCSIYVGWSALTRKDWICILVAAVAIVLLLGKMGLY
jgi:hypothetical protein